LAGKFTANRKQREHIGGKKLLDALKPNIEQILPGLTEDHVIIESETIYKVFSRVSSEPLLDELLIGEVVTESLVEPRDSAGPLEVLEQSRADQAF
jgi:hypothetical protein